MKKVILLSVSFLLISLAYSFAEVPCKINYQGRLIKDNVPVDGTKTMRFSIYDSAAYGTLKWTSGNVNITVHNGLFRYVLDLSSIDDWSAGQALYLEVIVDGETLTPREELSAYPYAINSHLLEGETKEYFINKSDEPQTKYGPLNIIGNVGIGTAGPNDKLVISNGAVRFGVGNYKTGSVEIGRIFIDNSQTIPGFGNDAWIFEKSDGNSTNPDSPIAFVTVGNNDVVNPRLVIQGSGNVGIGTTSPGQKLEVNGNLKLSTGNPYIYSGGSYIVIPNGLYVSGGITYIKGSLRPRGGIYNDSASYLTISGGTSGNTYFSGNVGIGTTSPGEKLTVAGTIESTTGGVKFPDGTLQTTAGGSQSVQVVGTTNIQVGSSWTDMTDMMINMNTTGGNVLLMFSGNIHASGNDNARAILRFNVDGNSRHNMAAEAGDGGWQEAFAMHWLEISLPAGSHTFKVQWREDDATVYQDGATYPRVFTVIELL